VYAPQIQPAAASVVLRLIGVLDGDLVTAFQNLERGLAAAAGATVLVDVRDLQTLGESDMKALASAIRAARDGGRDVRLDARSLPWRRLVKTTLPGQPAVDAELRQAVRRTVILAHSTKRKRN
jgi:anti-anti-sigma regulatory factor